MKITFLGAGSTVFVRNVLGDSMSNKVLQDCEIALYDIDGQRLKESETILSAINSKNGNRAKITGYVGVENLEDALRGANFAINAIQVGGYDPCTITDFEIPKKYGLRQTIADTNGIGGIMRALRTIPVMELFARTMEKVCPGVLFFNYVNPMSMLTGFMLRYTGVKTTGLCHSVQGCSWGLLKMLGMKDKLEGRRELIAGINHMGWLLEIADKNGIDLYPEIRRRAKEKNAKEKHVDMVRFDYIEKLGYYCTESSEHNSEYSPWYIKQRYPDLIEKFNVPLDEYPRRCISQIAGWKDEYAKLIGSENAPGQNQTQPEENKLLSEYGEIYNDNDGMSEYAPYMMEAVITNKPFKIGGNVLNKGGLIENLPAEACVEVPCMVDGKGINPCRVGRLPVQLAAMNMLHINVHLLTIEAALTKKREHIYHAAMLDPHAGGELSIDDIRKMVDELIEAHGNWLPKYH